MLLEDVTVEKVQIIAERYSHFTIEDMLSVNKQILKASNGEVNFNMVLEKLIATAFAGQKLEASQKLIETRNIFELYCDILLTPNGTE